MQPLFAFTATLVPRHGLTDAECFARLAEAVRSWAAAGDGAVESGRADLCTEFIAAEVTTPDGETGECRQVASVGRTRLGLQCSVTVRGSGDPICPKIVDKILDHTDAIVRGQPVPGQVVVADEHHAPAIADWILDPGRVFPLVVLSPHAETNQPLADPAQVLNELFGLAQVVTLSNRAATFALTNRLGNREWSCFHGAARIYWPNANPEIEPARRHPLFFPADHATPDGPERLIAELFHRVALAGAARVVESPIVRQARAAVEAARHAESDAKIAALTAGAAQAEELKRALAEAAAERQKLTEDRNDALQQAEEFEHKLITEREQWKTFQKELHDAHQEADRYLARADKYRDRLLSGLKKVIEAVRLAQEEFPDTLVFLPDAVAAADSSPYQNPGTVFRLFEALNDAAHRMHDGGLGEELFDFLKLRGFEYKPHVSQTSASKFGNEYHFNYKGKKLLFGNHVTLGSSHDPQKCLSIHWIRDEDAGLFVIGWCGRHLTNTRS